MSVPSTARPALLSLVEEHLTTLLRDAVTIQRHCKRARLHPDGATRQRLHAADLNLALQLQSSDKLYGSMHLSLHSPHQKVMLADILKEDMPAAPAEIAMNQHWLVVGGVQPEVPENPESIPLQQYEILNTKESSDVSVRVHQLQAGLLSEELKLYFLQVIAILERGGASQHDRNKQDDVLRNVQHDAGLQELVPFLVRYAQHAIYEHVTSNTDHCTTIVRLVRALLHNPTLHLELHLHELLPALMTCVVAQTLGTAGDLQHWALRREAATTLSECCALFGAEYSTLKSRVLHALCKALDGSLPGRYGGLVAIAHFGCRTIDAFLLPVVLYSWTAWEQELEKADLSAELELEIHMCQQAVLTGISTFLRETSVADKASRLANCDLEDVLADRMIIISGDETEYSMCFV